MWNRLDIPCCDVGVENSADRRKQAGIYPDTCWIANEMLYCCFGNYRMLAYKISACEVCIISRKPTEALKKSIANRRVKDWEASNGHTKHTTWLFHGPWHDPVGANFGGSSLNRWGVIAWASSKFGKFWLWRSRSITPQNNRDLNPLPGPGDFSRPVVGCSLLAPIVAGL